MSGCSIFISISNDVVLVTTMGGAEAYHHHSLQFGAHATRIFPSHRRRGAFTPGRDAPVLFGQIRGVGTAGFEFEHRSAELGFAEEEEAGVAGRVGLAVVGRLGGDVGEVDALAEGVAVHWCFGRGDAETLG